MATDKDTIYIDIDDEITGIIDKVKASEGKVVALVLPKRASVFQSIVNMKLLKRATDGANKNLVLITSEAGLLPLAGAAGIHVAKTLTSKPEIPAGPAGLEDSEETVNESEADNLEPAIDQSKPVGELAGPAAAAGAAGEMETLVLDDEDLPPEDAPATTAKKDFTRPPKKNKKFKVPNFERFRLLLVLLVLLLILIIAGVLWANFALAKATINIKTDAQNVDTNLNLNLSTGAQSLDPSNNTVPAKQEQQQKTYSQQVPTTGQKNTGNKADGSVTITNCSSGDVTIPAGSGLSSGGNTYITQDDVTVPDSNFTSPGSGSKCKNDGKASVDIKAQSGGSSFNVPSGSPFSVNGYSGLSGQGSASGGTDNIVQSVNQNDINNAKSKINTNDGSVKSALDSQLKGENYFPIDATFTAGSPNVTSSASVGEVANSVTVTETVTYTMFGVHKSDLQSLIDGNIQTQIDTSKQSILDDGLGNASFNVSNQSAGSAAVSMSTKAVVGPQLDVNAIKTAAEGQKAGAIKSGIENNPDVTSVSVSFSPFWVSSAPKKTSHITVKIAKPTTTKSANANSNQ